MAKDSLKALQRDFNTAFRERYGMDYNTGETPKNQTVEQLKAEGAMELERHAKELKKTIKKQTAEISWNDSKISEQTAEIDGLELTAKEQKAKLKKLKARESELDDEIVQKTATVDNLTHAGDTAEKRLKQIAKAQKFYLEQVYPRLAEISTDTTKSAFARQLAAVKAKNVDEAKTPEDFMQAVHMAARSVHIEEPDYDDEEELDYER